jgi:hypothetical protein
MIKVRERLKSWRYRLCKHKNKRFLRIIDGYDCFYCPNCLIYVVKWPDFTLKEVKEMVKQLKGGKKKDDRTSN